MRGSPYDVAIVGLGAMGSATAWHLSRRGYRVLGLDSYRRGHDRGSSHGRTRIIRQAYYESPDYVPLVRRSYELWRALEEESGKALLTATGGIYLGRPEAELVAGALASARLHGIPHEELDADEIRRRFPAFRVPDAFVGLYEPGAGLLDPEACVAALIDLAAARGAELHHEEPVRCWRVDGDGVVVETERERYRAGRLVLAAGAWIGRLLADLRLPLEIWRILHIHFEPERDDLFPAGRYPFALWEIPEGIYSAFPALPMQGVKFGRHDTGEVCTPETARREVRPDEVESLRAMLNRFLPGAGGQVLWTLTCLYTMTPDHHFIIDRHPQHSQVVYVSACSGHGFKFATVVGEILADLATEGTTPHRVKFLSAARFGRNEAREGLRP